MRLVMIEHLKGYSMILGFITQLSVQMILAGCIVVVMVILIYVRLLMWTWL